MTPDLLAAFAALTASICVGYAQLFGAAYVGSPLGRGAIWRAAQADAEVEAWRYKARVVQYPRPQDCPHAFDTQRVTCRWHWLQRCITSLE